MSANEGMVQERLRQLAEAVDLPVPRLVVDVPRQQERPPVVREKDGERRVVVPPSLVTAEPARQLWHLAACLGRWTSPVPKQRQRIGGVVVGASLVLYVVLLVLLAASVPWIWITVVLAYPIGAWALRWERQAMDDAGRRVLAAAGHPPAEVARAAFGDEPDPPFLKRILSGEPAPSRRIAAAEADAR
ncbi:hypothetical protein ACI797_00750 [Geodermatophilus sp. SYSU D00691]